MNRKGPLWSLMRSFLAGWGGVAFLRERLAARALGRSSSRGMGEESKTASSERRRSDLAFFIGGGGDGEEPAVPDRLVGRDMKWRERRREKRESDQHTIVFVRFCVCVVTETIERMGKGNKQTNTHQAISFAREKPAPFSCHRLHTKHIFSFSFFLLGHIFKKIEINVLIIKM